MPATMDPIMDPPEQRPTVPATASTPDTPDTITLADIDPIPKAQELEDYHPRRDADDTEYVEGMGELCLRQINRIEAETKPCPDCGFPQDPEHVPKPAHATGCALADVPFAPAAASSPDITQPAPNTDALDALRYVAGQCGKVREQQLDTLNRQRDVHCARTKPSRPAVSLFSLCKSRLSRILKLRSPE